MHPSRSHVKGAVCLQFQGKDLMLSDQRDLELMLMGAILADPELKNQFEGFSDGELDGVLQDLKKGNLDWLRRWLKQRQVEFSPGKGEALKAVRKQQRENWIRQQMEKANLKLLASIKFHATNSTQQQIERLQTLKQMLNPDETPKPKKLLKPPAPQMKTRTQSE